MLNEVLNEVLNKVLNGRYTAVFTSTALHIALLIALIYLSADTKIPVEKPISKPAIKSYIYQAPVKPSIKPIAVPVPEKKESEVIEAPKPVMPKKVEEQPIKDNNLPEATTNKIKPVIQPNALPKTLPKASPTVTPKVIPAVEPEKKEDEEEKKLLPAPPLPSLDARPNNSAKPLPKKKLSALDQLSRLRSSINNSVVNDAYKEHTQVRSASAMHGEQIPVPRSTKQLTEEEEYEKNTSSTGHNKITKNDNGTCTIRREQMLGSPVEATTSGFACGESKFDKNFREHMKKVRDKVMPNKR